MSRNSGTKRDKRKAAQKKLQRAVAAERINWDDPVVIQREVEKLFNPLSLTTPKAINEDLVAFCATISDTPPFYVDSEPELWSRQACCERNVAEYIRINEGQIVCGYRIWYNEPNYIEAERHALWYKNAVFKDVSFSPDGEKRFLFVPDIPSRRERLDDNLLRIRWGKDYKTKKVIGIQNSVESRMQIQRMSDEESWRTMPSYEDWLAGKRMPSLWLAEQ